VRGEFDLIERVFARLTDNRASIELGIGDDCALIHAPAGHATAVTTDTLVEGVHYPTGTAPADIGWKALACGLSDIAAMGAEAVWATLALTLPAADEGWLAGFADGFGELASATGVSLVGGDLSRGPHTVITVQAGGQVARGRALRRDGARPGDSIWVSGWPGEAAAGLATVTQGWPPAAAGFGDRLNRPQPRTMLGPALVGRATACIDVSDGLASDLGHILAASGVGATLERERLPVSPRLAALDAASQVQAWILEGGDDYELCFCLPDGLEDREISQLRDICDPVSCIGRIEPSPGLRLRDTDGSSATPAPAGYDHFAGERGR